MNSDSFDHISSIPFEFSIDAGQHIKVSQHPLEVCPTTRMDLPSIEPELIISTLVLS